MNKNSNSRNGFIHLYNPKEEGLGAYDVHYINAYKKNKSLKTKLHAKNKFSAKKLALIKSKKIIITLETSTQINDL